MMATSGLHIWFAAMLAGAVALVLAAIARARATWLLIAAFLAGTSAQLGLTDPLWFGSLQLRPDSTFTLLCYAVIAAQGCTVAALMLRDGRIGRLVAGLHMLGAGRVILLLVLLLGSLVAPMGFLQRHEYLPFAKQVIANAAFLLLNGVNLMAIALALPQDMLARLAARIDGLLSLTDRRLPWLAALWVFAVTLILALFAFDRMPRVPDEVAYLFQAKYFAVGHLYAVVPGGALNEALRYDWISMLDGKWFSIFPPGWPAMLAVGIAAGAPFLVNPLIAALTIPVGHAFVSRWVSPRFAILITLLLAVSPWYLAMGASLMSHSLTLLLVLLAWLLMLTEGRLRLAAWLAAGCLMGWLFLTRPLEGVIIGTLTGLWAMGRVDLRTLSGWLAVALYGLGCLVIGGLIFPYNQLLTGDALVTPIDQYFDLLWHPGANRLGFGADIGSPNNWGGVDIWPGHSPLEALIEAQFNLKSLNVELLGWPVGSMLLVYAHLIWGKLSRADWCMLSIILLTVAAYALYWFNGGFYIGPRYWFMVLWPALFLSARGLQTCAAIGRRADSFSHARERSAALVLLLGAVAMLSFMPWRAIAKYWEFRGFHGDYRELVESGKAGNALIFVGNANMGGYGSAFMLNRPDLEGPIFLIDRGAAANAEISARYPGRSVLMVEDRSASDGGEAK